MTIRIVTGANGIKYITNEPLPEGDIRAMKHRIHELEGELLGYKKIVADQYALLERQTERIVGLQDEIRNLTGEE